MIIQENYILNGNEKRCGNEWNRLRMMLSWVRNPEQHRHWQIIFGKQTKLDCLVVTAFAAHQSAATVVMKNWELFVFAPVLAIDSIPSNQHSLNLLSNIGVNTANFQLQNGLQVTYLTHWSHWILLFWIIFCHSQTTSFKNIDIRYSMFILLLHIPLSLNLFCFSWWI